MADRAKEIFLTYHGNHSAMANDGVYEEYKSYAVSRTQENEWMLLFSDDVVEKLAVSQNFRVDFVKACNFVRKTKNPEKLSQLFSFLASAMNAPFGAHEKLQMLEAFADTLIRLNEKNRIPELKEMLITMQNEAFSADVTSRAAVILEKLNNV